MKRDKALARARDELRLAKVVLERQEAIDLLALALECSRLEVKRDLERTMTPCESERYEKLVKRRAAREPFGYLAGNISFFGCELKITPDVLIPRQETEILASCIIQEINPKKGEVAWDLCSGSGCIGLAVKKGHPQLEVSLSDLSEKAVKIAKHNACHNRLDVKCFVGDLFAPFAQKKADYLFCNPPYLGEWEYDQLEPEVRLFEPKEALIGGKSGSEFFSRLEASLPSFLNSKAKIFFEIGAHQKEEIWEIFSETHWKQKRCIKDWSGHYRFFFLEFCP